MIDVKQAVKRAFEFLAEMYDQEELREPRLEEVQLSEDNRVWCITLSFARPATVLDATGSFSPAGALANALSMTRRYEREYKVIDVWAKDGTVRSMKIRQLA